MDEVSRVEGRDGYEVNLDGNSDWTPYKALSWKVENKSDHPVALWVRVIEPEKKSSLALGAGAAEGVLLRKYLVDPKSVRTITMDLPAPAPNPEVAEDFRLMRNNPYGRLTGFYSTGIDYSNVGTLMFINNAPSKDSEWEVTDIKLVPGEKYLPEAMRLPKDEFFPFIDTYGQFKYAEWPGKIHSDADLEKARQAEEKDLAANPGPGNRSKYGGWTSGPRLEATGHFRVEKLDGKWWMVDPDGYLFWSNGVVRVSHSCAVTPLEGENIPNRCGYFEDLPPAGSEFERFYRTNDALLKPYYTARGIDSTYDFSSANLFRKYGQDYITAFGDISHRRLCSWGLNTIANSSDREICLMDRTPYTDRFEIVSEPIYGTSGWWPVMDPFDPSFKDSIERQLTDRKEELEDPWCLGFFVDNEIAWGNETHMAEVVLKCPETQMAKRRFVSDLKAKYGTIGSLNKAWETSFASWGALLGNREAVTATPAAKEDMLSFNRSLIHEYYRVIRSAFDSLAPGVLYMGCRFSGYTPDLVTIGALYCDVISYNRYSFTTDSVVLPEGVDKPVMIGEFHFGATDRGMFHGSLIETETQEKRAEAYVRYVESALRHPQIIGVHWHQYSDQATTGRFDGENFQVGFTDVCDTPYPETIKGLRDIGYRLYETRYGAAQDAVSRNVMRYLDDPREYVLPSEVCHDVLKDKTINAEEFIQKYYEPLRLSNPKYISSDSVGVDDSGKYTMWCYTFTPRKYKKTVYLQAGVHGRNEYESYFALAMIMRLVTEGKKSQDPHIKFLRKNVRFVVIPVVNVFDTFERTYPPYNANNININRDWIDERTREIRNIKSLLSNYGKGEIQIAFDLHTDPEGKPGWGAYLLPFAKGIPSSISDKMLEINNFLYDQNIPGKVLYKGEDLFKAFMGPNVDYPISSREWREHRNENYRKGTNGRGCTAGIWNTFGIPCATLEHGSRKFAPDGSAYELTRAVELYLNHIVAQTQ